MKLLKAAEVSAAGCKTICLATGGHRRLHATLHGDVGDAEKRRRLSR